MKSYLVQINDTNPDHWFKLQAADNTHAAQEALNEFGFDLMPCVAFVALNAPGNLHSNGAPFVVHAMLCATEEQEKLAPFFLLHNRCIGLAELRADNADDSEVLAWLETAQVGDQFPSIHIKLQRLA